MKRIFNEDLLVVKPMLPEEMGRGGILLTIRYSFIDTVNGEMLVASTMQGICYLAFVVDEQEAVLAELKQLFPRATYEAGTDNHQQLIIAALDPDNEMEMPLSLHLKGTDFQLKVWAELMTIPQGQISSYGKIAAALGRPKACRAVGTAVGDNPVSVLIPCHRVLRSDGALGGYHWGLERKIKLLEQEGIVWRQKAE